MGVFTIAKIVKIKMDPSHWLVTYSPLQHLVAIEAAKISKPPFPSSGLVIFSQQVARIERLFLVKCIFPTRCPSSSQLHYDPHGSSHSWVTSHPLGKLHAWSVMVAQYRSSSLSKSRPPTEGEKRNKQVARPARMPTSTPFASLSRGSRLLFSAQDTT